MGEVLKFSALKDLNAESRFRGRKLLAIWDRKVHAKIEAGELVDFDARLARALRNFPSSTLEGHCWPRQARLARSLGRSRRSVERGLSRLKRSGLLITRQRGTGRSARYIFAVDGKPLFPSLERHAPARHAEKSADALGAEFSEPSGRGEHRDIRSFKERRWQQAFDNVDRALGLARRGDSLATSGEPSFARSGEAGASAPPKVAELSLESSKKLKGDSSEDMTLQPSVAAPAVSGGRKRAADEEKPSAVQAAQNAIVAKIGAGDIVRGWLVFGDLPMPIRIELEARERRGELSDSALAELLQRAQGTGV